MAFIDLLPQTPRLVVDPVYLPQVIAAFKKEFPDLAAAVLRPGPGGGQHTLLMHTDQRAIPRGGLAVQLALAAVEQRLGSHHSALVHAPFLDGLDLAPLFPGAASVFLRRAAAGAGDALLLAFHIAGLDAEFASRHGASILVERLRHRIDDLILQVQIRAVTERLERQVDEVRLVKEKLLPDADHRAPGAHHAVFYRACPGGGGDYFEIVDLRDMRRRLGGEGSGAYWGAMIADVSGHGPGAAVEVAMLDSILRTYRAEPGFHPGHVLTYCNRHMFTRQVRGGFVTVFLANYDADAASLAFASAGHPPALVKRRSSGAAILLECGGDIPLLVELDHSWRSETITFGPQDMLVLYTDGVIELESPDEAQLGIDGLRRIVEASGAADSEALLADIVAGMNLHAAGRPPADDCTIVVVTPQPLQGAPD